MTDLSHYVIRGGHEGRERLRVLARVFHRTTGTLFDAAGVGVGLTCLDVGCGGGDVTLELARRVGRAGRVIGVDMDASIISLARQEASQQDVRQVEFRALDIRAEEVGTGFDLVYARFLLTHLADPAHVIARFRQHLRPGGLLVVEDIDFNGHFTYPECAAFRRHLELYRAVVRKRGGDPDIGARLPLLVTDGGFSAVEVNVVQPMGLHGEVKRITPGTMENIADTVVQDGLASREEVDAVIRELYQFADNPRTLGGVPRIVQVWARRPAD